jgi:endonuclease YncB( thermonuclease family)
MGVSRFLDGDTVEINGTKVRLKGFDAPETMARSGYSP